MSQPCQNEKTIDLIDKRLDRMENKLDTLLEDKWRRIGAVSALSAVVAGVISLISYIVK